MRKIIKVEGMTCQHCVQIVTEKLSNIAGVERIEVSLEQKEVMVDFDYSQTQFEQMSAKIIEAGFEVVGS